MATLQLKDGYHIYYRFDGDENKPVLLFSCPLGFTHEVWDSQVEELAHTFRILRYDARGHGRSDVTPGPYTIEQLSQDVQELIETVCKAPVYFCGLSIGGMVGMHLGATAPQLFRRLVLANTSAWLGEAPPLQQRLKLIEREGMDAVYEDVLERSLGAQFREQNPAITNYLIEMIRRNPAPGYIAGGHAVLDMDLRDRLPQIKLPVLVIAGRSDTATPPHMGQEIVESVPAARLVTLDSAHLSNIEQARLFNQEITNFFL